MVEKKEKPTRLWYLVPLLLGIIGGIIGYFAVKDEDRKMARELLLVGILTSFVPIIILFLVFFSGLFFIPKVVQEEFKPGAISAKVGEPVKLNGLTLTVDSFKTSDRVVDVLGYANTSYKAKPNHKFVLVYLTVRNEGAASETFFICNTTITTDKGYTYHRKFFLEISGEGRESWAATQTEVKEYACKETSLLKSLSPAKQEKTCMIFEIWKDHEPATFNFQTKLIGGKAVSIKLTS